jgi:hypothetical protein
LTYQSIVDVSGVLNDVGEPLHAAGEPTVEVFVRFGTAVED